MEGMQFSLLQAQRSVTQCTGFSRTLCGKSVDRRMIRGEADARPFRASTSAARAGPAWTDEVLTPKSLQSSTNFTWDEAAEVPYLLKGMDVMRAKPGLGLRLRLRRMR